MRERGFSYRIQGTNHDEHQGYAAREQAYTRRTWSHCINSHPGVLLIHCLDTRPSQVTTPPPVVTVVLGFPRAQCGQKHSIRAALALLCRMLDELHSHLRDNLANRQLWAFAPLPASRDRARVAPAQPAFNCRHRTDACRVGCKAQRVETGEEQTQRKQRHARLRQRNATGHLELS